MHQNVREGGRERAQEGECLSRAHRGQGLVKGWSRAGPASAGGRGLDQGAPVGRAGALCEIARLKTRWRLEEAAAGCLVEI